MSRMVPGRLETDRDASPWRLPEMSGGGHKPAPGNGELERIRQSAYDEAFARGRREGYDAGFAEGREEGMRQGAGAIAQRSRRLQGLLDHLAEPLAELDDAVEDELARLALAIARQLIRRELRTQHGEVVGVVREAVALLPMAAREVQIQAHPEDAALLRETLGEGESAWRVVEDPALSPGGCHISAGASRIDATVEKRLAAVAADLLGDDRRPVPEPEDLS